ncbi:MAG: Major facilitator superfamily 1 [Chloroflexi bacterium]|nr:Major facilitator superfamily 1 [Chloroflexota bacterium]
MQAAALLWNIRDLTNQPIALGGIGLARIIPVVIFSLIAGAVADVVNRRNLLFLTQSALTFLALILAILSFTGKISLWNIYLNTALSAAVVAFDGPARQALVPNLVPADDLPNAFSLTSIAFQVGAIIGPGLGGLVIAYFGIGYTYLLNAISYGAVVIALVMMGSVPQQIPLNKRAAVSLTAIKEGIRFILSREIILSSMLLDFIATFFSSANTLLPSFSRDVLHVGAVAYGWLTAAQSIGAAVAALVISQLEGIRRQGPVFLLSVVAFGLATIAFGLSPTFAAAMVTLMLVGAADSVSTIIRNTIRQLQTPDYIRGRMTSINQIFYMGGPQLGEVEAGVVAQIFGVPFAIITGGIGCILGLGLIVGKWPALLHYNGDEPIEAGFPAD